MKSNGPQKGDSPLDCAAADLVREIAREHAAIHEVIGRIERELDRLLEHPCRLGARWELPDLARSCREHLTSHFRHEEGNGLLTSDALRGDPERRRAVEELIREHRDFERRIGRIVQELDMGFVPTETVQGCFDGELRSLIADMALHESKESELFQWIERTEPGPRAD